MSEQHDPRAHDAIADELGDSTASDVLEALDRAGLVIVARAAPTLVAPPGLITPDRGEEPPFAADLVAERPPHER